MADSVHPADFTLELRNVLGSGQRGGHALRALVDGNKASPADVEGIVLVVLELVLVRRVFVAGLQDLPGLLGHVRLRSELQQSPSETAGGFVVLQPEEEVEGGPEGEHLVDGLEIAVGEVGRHLTDPHLLLYRPFGQLLPLGLHAEADQVVGADVEQLLGLLLLALGLHHQEGDGEEDGAEAGDGLRELAGGCELVGGLQSGDQVGQLQTHRGQALLGPGLLVVGLRVLGEGDGAGQGRVRGPRP